MKKSVTLIAFVLSEVFGILMPQLAIAADVPQTFTLDGQLFSDSAGTLPLLDGSVSMKFQILDEDRVCVLYEETQAVNTVFSKGYFSVQIGSAVGDAKRSGSDTANGMSTTFQNINNINGKKVSDGTPCAVTASGGKRRYVRTVISAPTVGISARTLSPDLTIDSVPNAIIAERAESLQGFRSSEMLKVNTASGAALSQTNLESLFASPTRFNALTSVVDGTSTNYMRTTSAGAQLPVFTGAPTAPMQGSLWFDTSDQKMKYRTGTGTTEILGTSSGTLTSLTGDVSASGSGAVAATVNTVGASTAANIHAAEILANSATAANTVSTIVKRDLSGNFTAGTVTSNLVGNVTGAASFNILKAGDTMTGNLNFASGQGLVLTDSGANTVRLTAPTTVATNYVLKLPSASAASNGQVLASDTSGNLSWLTLPAAPISSLSVTAPIANSGTASAPNISIPAATSTNGGYLSAADWTTFNSKITGALNSGSIFVGNASNVATAVVPSQDTSVSSSGAFTVTGLRGRTVSSTAPADGQVLRYVNGTSTWTPTNFGVASLLTSVGTSQFASASCISNQTLTWTSLTDSFTCSNIGSLDASSMTSGTLPVARGGTGSGTLTAGSLLVGAGTGAITSLAPGTAGNIVYGTGSSVWASGTPETAGLVDKASAQTISGVKTFGASILLSAQSSGRFYDSTTTNFVALRAPSSVTTSYTLNLPASQGGASTTLSNDGSGNLSWTSMSGGSISSLAAGTSSNMIDSLNYAQSWNWSTATTQSPLSISGNALTTGSLLNLTSSSSALNSANGLLNVANSGSATSGVLARFQSNSNSNSGVTILNSGNVGIGTTTPSARLDISGADSSTADAPLALNILGGTGSSGAKGGGIAMKAGASITGGDGGDLIFSSGESNGSVTKGSTIQMTGGGWLGNAGDVNVSGGEGRNGRNGGTVSMRGGVAYGSNGTAGSISLNGAKSNEDGGDVVINGGLRSNGSHAHGNVLLANAQGNVGIGTPTPAAKLDVAANTLGSGNGTTDQIVHVNNGYMYFDNIAASPVPSLVFNAYGVNFVSFWGSQSGDPSRLYIGGASTESGIPSSPVMAWDVDSSNVGIGVAAPTSKLQIAGNVTPDATATRNLGASSLRWNNIYLSNAPDVSSDARLKKDVVVSDLGLDFVNSLRPVSWTWIDPNQGNTQHYGVIAQEAEKAIAIVKGQNSNGVIVTHNDETDTYSVRYDELISPLIKAIQELYLQFQILKAVSANQMREIERVQNLKADRSEIDYLTVKNIELQAKIENITKDNVIMKRRLDAIEIHLHSKSSADRALPQ